MQRCFSLYVLISVFAFTPLKSQSIQLQWIDNNPTINSGVSWGVPFEKGKYLKNQQFSISADSLPETSVQSWPLAYWPDGSVKWMGFAASGIESGNYFRLKPVKGISVENPLTVITESQGSTISNGKFTLKINASGENIISYIGKNNQTIVSGGKLISRVREGNADDPNSKFVNYRGKVTELINEQTGPIRSVTCLKGNYYSEENGKHLFPFTLRIYCYRGVENIRIVHSFVYDGDQDKDFIVGTGISFDVPFRESLHNRHIAFSGENGGIWKEPVKPLVTRSQIRMSKFENALTNQMQGKRVPEVENSDTPLIVWYPHLPAWDNYKLTQLHPGGFTIFKQSQSKSSWLQATTGGKSSGLAYVGDVSGGIALSLKDFWQSYPASMEIAGARSSKATLKTWFWSPDGPAMDLRHYDTIAHDLDATYEDVQPGLSTPYGVARTSELTLYLTDSVPSNFLLSQMAAQGAENAQLVCTPEYLHQNKAFGIWSLPDRTTGFGNWLENQLDSAFLFYQSAVGEHQWYGFWNYGDVMHTYDPSRHAWRYDIGGFAWANTELAPNNWLWYSFLRTGRADIFKMAEAMTRHTGEVDAYHLGEMKGLGTRHNVTHWGCGAKEARIGQAAWKRFHYFLTTDERSGDLMKESLDAEKSMIKFEPLRIAQPKEKFPYGGPTRLRWGPDWLALAGNWMTEWERTGNTYYRNKIITGLDCLSQLPDNLFTGPNGLSYDPETGKIWYDGKPDITNKNHLATIMGGFEILMEMMEMIPHPAFRKMLIEYGKFYSMSDNDPARNDVNKKWGDINFRNPRMTAFAAQELKNSKLAERAWKEFLGERTLQNGQLRSLYDSKLIDTPDVIQPVHENPRIGTNGTSQWGLNAIIMPELIGEYIPDLRFQSEKEAFNNLNNSSQVLLLKDDFSQGIHPNWFVDGKKACFFRTANGLKFYAGSTPASDADHSVLWTNRSFSGNIKIEFDFIRRDEASKFVNIIYLFAEGSGKEPYSNDIYPWKNLREIPAMKQYFNHMNLFHLSFAAFENDNSDASADYIRARRYLPETGKGLNGTEILPEFLRTGFFQPGVKHHITIIRHQDDVYMEVKNQYQVKLYHWKSDQIASLLSGRIGLRLMGSRVSEFGNFNIFQLK